MSPSKESTPVRVIWSRRAHLVDDEGSCKIAAFPFGDLRFRCVGNVANFMAAILILDVQTND